MTILLGFSYLLALFPLIVSLVFPGQVAERRQKTLLDDLRGALANNETKVAAWGGEQGIRNAIVDYYSRWRLVPLALFLSALYWLGFQLSYCYLNGELSLGEHCAFAPNLAKAAGPICLTFIGVYAFNMGTAVRRLYLDDLSETMFWSGINRVVLSEVLTLALIKIGPNSEMGAAGDLTYFAVGFLANPFLARILEMAGAAAKLGSGSIRTAEISLRSVQGINIWKEYRLEEEGIDSVENLYASDVIGLAIKTHYSVRMIVDWVDQAALIIRFRERITKLTDAGIAVSAIEFAWRSPSNNGNRNANALIAQKLEMDPILVEDAMDALYEDEAVQDLWRLWQYLGRNGTHPYSPPTTSGNGNSHAAAINAPLPPNQPASPAPPAQT